MLWYKAWLETRWRLVIGLVILILSASGTVLGYPEVRKLLSVMPNVDLTGEIGRRVAESAELARDYRSYVWSQWFMQEMTQQWALFAVLLGSGGLLAQASGGASVFTLSLPVSRNRLLAVRAATGLAELLVLAVVPSLVLPVLSPTIGQSYSIGDALIHAACMFTAGAVFFSVTFLLSTVFTDIWRPALIVLCAAVCVALFEQVFRDLSRFSLYRVMGGEVYFRSGQLPWLGLIVSAGVSMAALFGATRNIARRDF